MSTVSLLVQLSLLARNVAIHARQPPHKARLPLLQSRFLSNPIYIAHEPIAHVICIVQSLTLRPEDEPPVKKRKTADASTEVADGDDAEVEEEEAAAEDDEEQEEEEDDEDADADADADADEETADVSAPSKTATSATDAPATEAVAEPKAVTAGGDE